MAHDLRSPHIFVDGPGSTASGDQVMDNFDAAWLGIDAAQAVPGGFNAAGVVRRGKSIIATSESRSNVAYGTLTTPDQVSGIVLPADGLICVLFKATWAESVASAARAAIFVGANQLRRPVAQFTATVVQEADLTSSPAATDAVLTSYPPGLVGLSWAASAYSGDVTTGQAVSLSPDTTDSSTTYGGPAYIFAAAGTYTISVQFKAISGSVTVKDRKLWVWTMGF